MAIKPILFNTEMVRAILDGRKTCTRRVIKPQWEECPHCRYVHNEFLYDEFEKVIYCARCGYPLDEDRAVPCQEEDILYVRETWQYLYELDGNEQVIEDTGKYYYAATDTIPFDTYVDENGVKHDHAPWKPSIHMPKEAARIWLKVTDVRVERLQSITVEGAIREGAEGEKCHHTNAGAFGCTDCMNTGWIEPPQVEFMQIWDSTIKKSDLDRYGWNANPWVWVIEFELCEKPQEV